MFLAQRKTNGNDIRSEAIITIKATLRLAPKNKNEIMKAAIPMPTFKP